MQLAAISRWVCVLFALAAFACSPVPPSSTVQRVVVVDPTAPSYWLTGSFGFVAAGEGTRLSRLDFPASSAEPDWAYEASMFPGAHPVVAQGETLLVTHGGHVLRRAQGGWQQVGGRLPGEYGDSTQVDQVLVEADGKLWVHVHGQLLLRASALGLLRGELTQEQMPKYIWNLHLIDGVLHGVSYEGEQRAIFVRTAPGKWAPRALLPASASEPFALGSSFDGGIVAVTAYGLHAAPKGSTATRFLPGREIADLSGVAPLVVAGGSLTEREQAPQQQPPQPQQQPVERDGSAGAPALSAATSFDPASLPGLLASGTAGAAPNGSEVPIAAAFQLVSGRLALVMNATGSVPGIALVGPEPTRLHRCDLLRARRVVGVVERSDGLLAITSRGSVLELGSRGACSEAQPPLLPE